MKVKTFLCKCSKSKVYMCEFDFADHRDDDNRLGFWFGLVWLFGTYYIFCCRATFKVHLIRGL